MNIVEIKVDELIVVECVFLVVQISSLISNPKIPDYWMGENIMELVVDGHSLTSKYSCNFEVIDNSFGNLLTPEGLS